MNETVEKIITSSIKIFNRDGITKASISSIAKAAGISKGTLYYYFPAKEDLVNECFNYVKSNALDYTTSNIDFTQTPEQIIKHLVRSSFQWPMERPGELEYLDLYIHMHFYDKNVFELFPFGILENDLFKEKFLEYKREKMPNEVINHLIGVVITTLSKYLILYPDYFQNEAFVESAAEMVWSMVSGK